MKKTYHFEVKIISDCMITAKTKKEAKKILEENWLQENNIELDDDEITLID